MNSIKHLKDVYSLPGFVALAGVKRHQEDPNKIRVIQRRAYGIKDMEYLGLKIITSFLKEA